MSIKKFVLTGSYLIFLDIYAICEPNTYGIIKGLDVSYLIAYDMAWFLVGNYIETFLLLWTS